MAVLDALKSGIASVGYGLGLGGFGVTEPMGTKYNVNQTPYSVYNATNSYSNPIPTSYNSTTAPMGYQPYSSYGGSGIVPKKTPSAPTGNPTPSGSVLGTNDNNANNVPSQPSYADQLYASLGSAYNNLSGQLDPMYQRRKQGIEDLYGAGINDINLQQQAGLDTLGNQRTGVQTNQVRNLKDLANAMVQSFGSFSNQLGNMGAGDSSAARVMMPYALSRVEAGQRGAINRTTADKLGEIDQRESQLQNTVLQEKNKLDQAKMGEMASLGEWFDNAKMQISQMKLSDAKAAGEQAMQYAMQKLQGIEDNFNARKNALDSWAISNSKDLASLKTNLTAMTDPALLGQLPQFQGLNINQSTGQSTGGYQAPVGFGYGSPEDIFKKLGVA